MLQLTDTHPTLKEDKNELINPANLLQVAFIAVIFGALYLISTVNYLLFHGIVELAGIAVAFSIFIIVWNTRRVITDGFFLIIGISFLFFGSIDLVHTLAYKGMGVFPGDSSDLPTQLWIAARYFQSVTFLVATLFIGRSITRDRKYDVAIIIAACTAVCALIFASIFVWQNFPHCFIEGSGLTPFKIASEYIISLILIATIVILYLKREHFDPTVWKLLIAAQAFLILGELAFTSYISVFGFMNMLGHLFRLLSVYLFYRAFVVISLTRPYDLLLRELKVNENTLRESKNYVKTVLDSIDAGFMVIDPATHRILDVNPIAVRLIGDAKEKIIGSECHRYVCPAEWGSCPITDLHQTVDHSEHVLLKAGHEQCPIIKTVIPVTLGGKPVLLESFIDITLQKQAEETLRDFNKKLQQGIEEKTATLRDSELRHLVLFESSQDAIMTLEPPDWRFTSGNPATLAMFRAKDEAEFTSARLWDLSPEYQPDGRPSGKKAKEQIEKAVREGSLFFEWTHKRLNGEEFPATVLLTRFEWKKKQILQATVRDITEQKRAEEALHLFKDLVEHSTDAIGMSTPEGRHYYQNKSFDRMFGEIGDNPPETVYVDQAIGKHVFDTIMGGGSWQGEVKMFMTDRTILDILLRAYAIKNHNGCIIGLVGLHTDITEQKHAEDKIKASLDEKVLLLREIHHRVKNNLQIIISLVNLQMRQIDDERLKQVMAETQNRVRAMAFVHEKLYQSEDISRIDLANYTRFLVTQLFSFYGVDFRQVTLNVDIGKIMFDINTAIPLGLIINELASNALKHAFSHGRTGTLSITIREEDKTLHLTVKDDGVGIPADFDWRNAESLGLRLVISLVDQLDGTIELDRSAGTAFTIVVQEKNPDNCPVPLPGGDPHEP